jgi:translation initiation factor IF-2
MGGGPGGPGGPGGASDYNHVAALLARAQGAGGGQPNPQAAQELFALRAQMAGMGPGGAPGGAPGGGPGGGAGGPGGRNNDYLGGGAGGPGGRNN